MLQKEIFKKLLNDEKKELPKKYYCNDSLSAYCVHLIQKDCVHY